MPLTDKTVKKTEYTLPPSNQTFLLLINSAGDRLIVNASNDLLRWK